MKTMSANTGKTTRNGSTIGRSRVSIRLLSSVEEGGVTEGRREEETGWGREGEEQGRVRVFITSRVNYLILLLTRMR